MSLTNKYTRDIKDVNSHSRSNLERKRSEVILRLSELDDAVKFEPPSSPPRFRNKPTNNQKPRVKMSGAQQRRVGIERAVAIGVPVRNRKRRKPKAPETTASGIQTRKSPRRVSVARQRTKPIARDKLTRGQNSLHLTNTKDRSPGRRHDTNRSNRNARSPINRSLRPASEKYDPAFPTSNDLNRHTESRRHNPASTRDSRKSRSPIHRSTSNKNTYSRLCDKDILIDRTRSPDFRSTIIRDSSPSRRDRNRNTDHPTRSHSPGRLDRNRHRTSPGRFDRNRITSHPTRSRSPGNRSSSNVYGNYRPRDSNTDIIRNNNPDYHSSSKDRYSRRYDSSARVDDLSADPYSYANSRPDAAFNFEIPTNCTNKFIERSLDIHDRDSRWHDTSRAMHSYSLSGDYRSDLDRIFNPIDRNRYSNDMTIDNVTSNNPDRLRSRGSDYSLPLDASYRTRQGVPSSFKDVPKAPRDLHASTSSDHGRTDAPKVKTDLIRLSIVPVDYPKVTLTKSQADDIELALISHIKPGAAGTGPQFSYISFLQRTLVAGCKNMETKLWLEDTVPRLQVSNVGPLKTLTTKELVKSGTLPKVTMFVPNPIAKKPASTLLTLIKTQNIGLQTENWRILGSNDKPGGLSMALLIDNDSLATLEKLELKACLGLTQAKFTLIRGRREQ